ncbi:MAG: alpha/beta hydrolase [Cyclobacteriaceae bacterium]|nr:alpha/beta hydrolase [Cyclobacteriaceae bacterium]
MKIRLLIFLTLTAYTVIGKPIHSSEAVAIGGIMQWMTFQGEDDQAPVLLFIHGGPGNSVIGYADTFTAELKKHFIVVQWDQRESGKTRTLNTSREPLTVSIFLSDAVETINFLSARFKQETIYVMGHSWGGYLALRVAAKIPDKIRGLIAISPMVHQVESERLSLQVLRDTARVKQNQEAITELAQVEIPFQNSAELFYHRKWLSKLMHSTTPTRSRVEQWSQTWLTLFNDASQTNFLTDATELKCPVYFLIGSRDYQTYFKLTETYYQQVDCPEKNLYWFTQSAHNPHLTEPKKFQQTVINIKNKN